MVRTISRYEAWTKERHFAHWIDARSWQGWNNWKEKSVGGARLSGLLAGWPLITAAWKWKGACDESAPSSMKRYPARIFTLWNLESIEIRWRPRGVASLFCKIIHLRILVRSEKVKRFCFRVCICIDSKFCVYSFFFFFFCLMLLKLEVRVLSYSFSIEGTKKRKVFEIADDRTKRAGLEKKMMSLEDAKTYY